MGERTRENTRNFFSLDFLTGNNARRQAAENERRATDLWMGEWNNLPDAEDYYFGEEAVTGPGSAFYNNAEYNQGQAAQLQALRQMQGIAGAGGYTLSLIHI